MRNIMISQPRLDVLKALGVCLDRDGLFFILI
jgi:hypothetical protein